MVPFSYLRRATNTVILRRLLNVDEHALPQTIKFVAARALNGDNNTLKVQCKVPHGASTFYDIASLIQEKIRRTTADEWDASAIIAVVFYLARAGAPVMDHTKAILIEKVDNAADLKLIDLWQLPDAAKRLRIVLPTIKLKNHLESNVDVFLAKGCCKNVNSVINAFTNYGIAIDPGVLCRIAKYYRNEAASNIHYKNLTNLTNSFATHVCMILRRAVRNVGLKDAERDVATYALLDTLKSLIEACLEHIKDDIKDVEGMVDVLDALMLYLSCKEPDTNGHRHHNSQIRRLLDSIDRAIQCSQHDLLSNTEERLHYSQHNARNLEPRVLRVLLRNMVLAGIQHQDLLWRIMQIYRGKPVTWSAQGHLDLLRNVVFFGYVGDEVGDLAGHITSLYHGNFKRHVDPGKALIDACILAVADYSQSYYARCMRLVVGALSAIDSIRTSDVALAMLVLGIRGPSYDAIPINTLQAIVRRLQSSTVALEVHTRVDASSVLCNIEAGYTVFHSDFACLCKIQLI